MKKHTIIGSEASTGKDLETVRIAQEEINAGGKTLVVSTRKDHSEANDYSMMDMFKGKSIDTYNFFKRDMVQSYLFPLSTNLRRLAKEGLTQIILEDATELITKYQLELAMFFDACVDEDIRVVVTTNSNVIPEVLLNYVREVTTS